MTASSSVEAVSISTRVSGSTSMISRQASTPSCAASSHPSRRRPDTDPPPPPPLPRLRLQPAPRSRTGDIRVDEDGGRVRPNPVSGSGAYWAGWLLRSYRLQLGADGEPVVVSEDSGRSGCVTCRGRSVPKWAYEPPKSPSQSSAGAPNLTSVSPKRGYCLLDQLSPTSKTLSSAAC